MRNKNARLAEIKTAHFKPAAYDAAREFSPREWHLALALRYPLHGPYRTLAPNREGDEARISLLLSEPLALRGNSHPSGAAIEDTCMMEILCASESILEMDGPAESWRAYKESESKKFDGPVTRTEELTEEEWMSFIAESNAPLPEEPLLESFNEACDMRSIYSADPRLHVVVDMSAPDSVLIERFREWLADKRANSPRAKQSVKAFSNATLTDWAKFRILAYLDLVALHRHFGEPVPPNHALGALIFPEEFGVDLAERMRKVVRPYAEKALDSLEALAYAASLSERNRD